MTILTKIFRFIYLFYLILFYFSDKNDIYVRKGCSMQERHKANQQLQEKEKEKEKEKRNRKNKQQIN